MHYKLAQLILRSSEKRGTTAEVYISQPDSEKENLAGKLFILIELNSKTAGDLKIVNFLIQNLEHNYYQNEKLILREKNQGIKIEHIFELAIAKTNRDFTEFLRNEKIKFNYESIHSLAGIIHESGLFFSSIGKNKAFLVYKDQSQKTAKAKNLAPQKQKYKIINVIEKTGGNENLQAEQAKIFSNIISGAIPTGGYFVFANEALSEYLTPKQLIDITTTLPPIGAVEQIKNTLSQINSYVSFLGIIIKNTQGLHELEPKKELASASAQASITNLNSVEKATEKFLAPGGHSGPAKILEKILSRKPKSNPIGMLKEKIFFKKKQSFIFGRLFGSVKIFFSYFFGFAAFVFRTLTSRDKMAELAKNTAALPGAAKQKTKDSFLGLKFWYKGLGWKNKLLFFITIASFVLTISNTAVMSMRNKRLAIETDMASAIQEIEQKQAQIEANLLYNNEAEVKKILPEIQVLLEKLPKDNETYIKLYNKNNEYLEKIRHIIKLNEQKIADLPEAQDNLIFTGDKLITAARNAIAVISAGGEIENSLSIEGTMKLAKPIMDAGKIYYFNGNNLTSLDIKTQKTEILAISEDEENIGAASIYNGRIYITNTNDNQIYSFRKSGANFSSKTAWLKDDINLNNTVSMDIDGHIYALKENGMLLKFLKGELENFELEKIDPEINSPGKIIAKSDSDYIYILEPEKKRLAIFDKNGKFLTQHVLSFNITDFAVDEKNKTFYFLSGASVYKADAGHLK